MKKRTALFLMFFVLFALLPVLPAQAATTRTEEFVYNEDFNSTPNGELPAGWYVQMIQGGKTAAVTDGALIVDGTGSDGGRTLVRMPVAYRYTTDFVFEADFTITAANNTSRWGSLAFRMGEGSDPTYHQMAVRQLTTESNGVEFATWDTTWKVHKTGAYVRSTTANTYYRLKVVVSGNTVKEYINDMLIVESTTSYDTGSFGIGCAGCVIKVDNISITGKMDVPVTDDGYYFKDDFSTPTAGWRADYRVANCEPYATIGISGGQMIIDSTGVNASSGGTTTLLLPESVDFVQDFVMEADFTILGTKDMDATRWGALMYRVVTNGKTSQTEIGKPYLQMAIRQNAMAGNGVEVAYRKSTTFSVLAQTAFSETIFPNKTYRLKIMVCGNRVVQYINDQKTIDYTGIPTHRGSFGISTAGAKIMVDNLTIAPIRVSDMPEKVSAGYATEVYEPSTGLVLAPTTIWQADATLPSVIGSARRPATVQGYVDAMGQVWSMDKKTCFGSLYDFTVALKCRAIPAFYIDTQEAADGLIAFLKEHSMKDSFVWSNNPALVKTVHTAVPHAKGVVQYDAITDRYDVVHNTNANLAKIAVVHEKDATRDNLLYWQRRMMTVWVISNDDIASVHTNINIGSNGIVTTNWKSVIDAIESYSETTVTRKSHVIGHRGMPQGTLNENFISSFTGAYNAGAEMFEVDIYLTKDNQLVVMHDETVDRTTNGTGDIRNYTLAQATALKSKYNPAENVPSLEDVFKTFKGKDIVIVVELKAGTDGLVPALATLVEKYDMYDQINVITFHPGHMQKMQEYLPGISRGYLNMVMPAAYDAAADLTTLFNTCSAGGWTCNPNYNNTPNSALLEAAKHRGMTFWPYTFNSLTEFDKYTMMGIQGLTTDYAARASDYYTHMTTTVGGTDMKPNEKFSAVTKLYQRNGTATTVTDAEIIRLWGNIELTGSNGLYAPVGEGEGVFCFRKRASLSSGQRYWLYSEAFHVKSYSETKIISVTESDAGEEAVAITTKAVSREEKDIPLQLIACAYDANGRLLSVKKTEESLASGVVQSYAQTMRKPSNTATVAVFIWRDDFEALMPFDTAGAWLPNTTE